MLSTKIRKIFAKQKFHNKKNVNYTVAVNLHNYYIYYYTQDLDELLRLLRLISWFEKKFSCSRKYEIGNTYAPFA